MPLNGRVVSASDISSRQRDEMFSLMETFYENMDRASFRSDLDSKDWVILLEDERKAILGFSTQKLIPFSQGEESSGDQCLALFSGDTIVHRDYWAQNPLATVWGRFALSLIDQYPDHPLFWFLISKGYRTYRFLPVFFHDFYPRFDSASPAWATDSIEALATGMFAEAYQPHRGVLSWQGQACRLREGVAELSRSRLGDPHLQFFANANPGHRIGDELCCIAPLTRENFTPAAYRVIGHASQFADSTS